MLPVAGGQTFELRFGIVVKYVVIDVNCAEGAGYAGDPSGTERPIATRGPESSKVQRELDSCRVANPEWLSYRPWQRRNTPRIPHRPQA